MKNEPLVTVVIPIYNTERYLSRCIDSVLSQTYRCWELVLVDDGSSDGCPAICDDYAKRDGRIRVIHKENAGLGMARNTGIDAAGGEYLCFFDSDDYVEPDTLEVCVAAAVANEADMVIFGHLDETPTGDLLRARVPHPPKSLLVGEEIVTELLPASLYTNQDMNRGWETALSACNKLFSLQAIRDSGWRFVSEREIIAEDYYSLTALHAHLRRVCVLDRTFYHYMVNTASLSRSFKADRFEKIKTFYAAMQVLSNDMGLSDVLDQPIKSVSFGLAIAAMKQLAAADWSLRRRCTALKQMICDDTLQAWVRTTDSIGAGWQKKLLCTAVKYKWVWLCFVLLYLKNRQGTR